MKKLMFAESGNWYKGNLHSHTTNSDGKLSPEEAVKLYKSYGYHFMCLSDHDVYTDLREQFDCEDFILLPGVEASVWLVNKEKTGLKKTHHIHGILGNEAMQKEAGDKLLKHGERLEPPIFIEEWNGLEEAQKLSDKLRERGCFTTYNHPVWSRVDIDEVADLKNVWAVEIYNYGTEIECGEGYDKVFWESMLRKGTHIHGFASDDNHNHGKLYDSLTVCSEDLTHEAIVNHLLAGDYHFFASDDNHNPEKLFDSFGGYVMVRSEELTHEAIVNHLLAGDYYFTAGPQIYQWGIEDQMVFVECSDAERIHFIVGGTVGSSETILRHTDPLNYGCHKLHGNETYVRIECVDDKGQTAWTNVLWLE